MSISDLLPWINLLILPVLKYVMDIDRRLTRIEAARAAEKEARDVRAWGRRTTDGDPQS